MFFEFVTLLVELIVFLEKSSPNKKDRHRQMYQNAEKSYHRRCNRREKWGTKSIEKRRKKRVL